MALLCSTIESGALSGTIEVNIVGANDQFAEFTVCNNSSNTAEIGEICFDTLNAGTISLVSSTNGGNFSAGGCPSCPGNPLNLGLES